jgi:hypothetical protein
LVTDVHGLGVYVALAARSSRSRRRDAESAYASFAHRLEIAPPGLFFRFTAEPDAESQRGVVRAAQLTQEERPHEP